MVDLSILRPGDKVKVTHENNSMFDFVPAMGDMCGQTLTISRVPPSDCRFKYADVEENGYSWPDYCLEYIENVSLMNLLNEC